jgi:myo-inositol-1(or 4)-monophosphatase
VPRSAGVYAGLVQAASHQDSTVVAMLAIVRQAGEIARGFFRPGAPTSAEVAHKAGGSPVTEADHLVDAFLKARLMPLVPEAGWLSEETADTAVRLQQRLLFIVDPIDGTRGYAAGELAWSVAVALVGDGRPLVGIVHAPSLDETYVAVAGQGARLNDAPIAVSERGLETVLRLGAPRNLAQKLAAAGLSFELQPRVGSLAVRLAHVASGVLDAGLAGGNSHDWDIAAADLILCEAGGLLTTVAGAAPLYNQAIPRHGLLVAAPQGLHAAIRACAGRAVAMGAG